MSEAVNGMHQELAALKAEVSGLKVDIADVKAETRVTKHDVANLSTQFNAIGHRLEKLEDKLGAKIDALAERLTGVNLQQARGIGFFAGMGAVATVAVSFIAVIIKLLFAK